MSTEDFRQGRASSDAAPSAAVSGGEHQRLLDALRASIAALSKEEQRALALSLCSAVDGMSRAIVENADALWAARGALDSGASGSPASKVTRPDQPKLPESVGIGGSSIGLGAEGEQ